VAEWVGIVQGIVLVGMLGYLLAQRKATTGRVEAPKTPEEWERRYELLAADVNDALDKIEHLYDRMRKRVKADPGAFPREDLPNGQAFPARPMTRAQVNSEIARRGLIMYGGGRME